MTSSTFTGDLDSCYSSKLFQGTERILEYPKDSPFSNRTTKKGGRKKGGQAVSTSGKKAANVVFGWVWKTLCISSKIEHEENVE
jgi:hypothetical protein